MRRAIVGLCVLLALVAVGGCAQGGGGGGAEKGPITVGSKIDTEGELLSEIIRQVLEADGFEVVDDSQTGTTEVVRKALLDKKIDVYPEYTGSGLIFFEGSDAAAYKNGEKGYQEVKRRDLRANGVVWLSPARANNTWAICTTKELAASEGLEAMSDFARYVNDGKPVKIAASDEFFNNSDADPAFERVYGYSIDKRQKVVFSGGNTAQTENAVAEGTDGVNFGMAYGTDGALADLGLVVLDDDKHAQLVYWPCPITRTDVVDRYPEIESLLKPPFDGLTLRKLQQLNGRIQVNGEAPEVVARDYLVSGGFIK